MCRCYSGVLAGRWGEDRASTDAENREEPFQIAEGLDRVTFWSSCSGARTIGGELALPGDVTRLGQELKSVSRLSLKALDAEKRPYSRSFGRIEVFLPAIQHRGYRGK